MLGLATVSLLAESEKGEKRPVWENEKIFRIGKEEPRATSMPFATKKAAQEKERLESSYCQLLNGKWKFHHVGNPKNRPVDFYKVDFDVSSWDEIQVPANWQIEGYGGLLYSNATYPFAKNPPRVMDEPPGNFWTFPVENRNQVGSYRRDFTIPKGWGKEEVYLSFEGVDSAFFLFVNGEKVGYSQDSRTTAEFRITDFLVEGNNVLAVEVYQYCDGSYLEDQDMWRLSGIFRDVFLHSAAKTALWDYELNASVADDYRTGTLTPRFVLRNLNEKETSGKLTMQVNGSEVFGSEFKVPGKDGQTELKGEEICFEDAKLWTAETPNLYDVLIEVAVQGEKPRYYSFQTGFKRQEIKNGQFLVNGKAILFKGVNRHDHDPVTGHYVTAESLARDVDVIKGLNMNAVRCSHYPNDPFFYELCSKKGLYVIDEANLEAHGTGWGAGAKGSLARVPSWKEAHLDRARNMLERDKNHPCIVMWSIGNESGDGVNTKACSAYFRKRDSSRPVHYEQAGRAAHVDLITPMYMPIRASERFCREEEKKPLAKQRPLIQCEYSHAMGNSSGNLADYWELFRSERLLQGGFIWDLIDQGLIAKKHAADVCGKGTHLMGVLTEEDGIPVGGVLVENSEKLSPKKSVKITAYARGNKAPQTGEENNNRNESDGYPIVTKGDTSYSLKVDSKNRNIEFFVFTGDWVTVRSPLPLEWQKQMNKIEGSYDGKALSLAINGKEVASKELEGVVRANGYELAIGLNAERPSRRFDGSIQAVKVEVDGEVQVDLNFSELAKQSPSVSYIAYGGDHGDQPNDRSFCLNGIVRQDRSWSPQAYEVHKVHEPIHVSQAILNEEDEPWRFIVRNEYDFLDLKHISASFDLLEDGKVIAKGSLPLPDCEPGERKGFEIPRPKAGVMSEEKTYHLRFGFFEIDGEKKGRKVAFSEHLVQSGPGLTKAKKAAVEWNEKGEEILAKSKEVEAVFSKNSGSLLSYRVGGKEQLAGPLELNFWRPPINNDEGAKYPAKLSSWYNVGRKMKVKDFSRKGSQVSFNLRLGVGSSDGVIVYTFEEGGALRVETTITPKKAPILPRVGMQLQLLAEQKEWAWFGLGPHENYVDRKASAWTGIHKGTVDDLFTLYSDPQESGQRGEVRWATFTGAGRSLRIEALGGEFLEIGAYPYAPQDIELARHPQDLRSSETIFVNIDHKQMGVGGTNSWGQEPLGKYRIKPKGRYQYSFRLQPES